VFYKEKFEVLVLTVTTGLEIKIARMRVELFLVSLETRIIWNNLGMVTAL